MEHACPGACPAPAGRRPYRCRLPPERAHGPFRVTPDILVSQRLHYSSLAVAPAPVIQPANPAAARSTSCSAPQRYTIATLQTPSAAGSAGAGSGSCRVPLPTSAPPSLRSRAPRCCLFSERRTAPPPPGSRPLWTHRLGRRPAVDSRPVASTAAVPQTPASQLPPPRLV